MKTIVSNLTSLLRAIELCINERLSIPALSLIYVGMDIAGSLYAEEGETSKKAFLRWVNDFLLPSHPLPCSALDLYSARCATLHTFTAFSDLSETKKAQTLVYAWGDANADLLSKAFAKLGQNDVCAISIESLFVAYKAALQAFFDRAAVDPNIDGRINERATNWFDHLPKEAVQELLKRMESQNGP